MNRTDETNICACGKEFHPRKDPALEKFCSRKCNAKYGWYGRHAWLFKKKDLKQYRDSHIKYKATV